MFKNFIGRVVGGTNKYWGICLHTMGSKFELSWGCAPDHVAEVLLMRAQRLKFALILSLDHFTLPNKSTKMGPLCTKGGKTCIYWSMAPLLLKHNTSILLTKQRLYKNNLN